MDVVVIHGQLEKHDKFRYMQIFSSKLEFKHFCPRVGVFNGAANTGFDLPRLPLIVRFGLPPDLATLFQERGRLVREEGTVGRIIFIASIKAYLDAQHLIHNPNDAADTDTFYNEDFGKNSAINLKRQSKTSDASTSTNQQQQQQQQQQQKKKKSNNKEATAALEHRKQQLLEVMQFLFLKTGCKHAEAEYCMSSGEFGSAPDSIKKCGTKCFTCDATVHGQQFRPVFRVELVKFFESEKVRNKFELPATSDCNGDSLTDLLWNDDKAIFNIFNCKKNGTIKKRHVETLMLQLVASEIIVLSVVRKTSNNKLDMKWKFNRELIVVEDNGGDEPCDSETVEETQCNNVEKESVLCYNIDKYWMHIHLFPASKKKKVLKKKNDKPTGKKTNDAKPAGKKTNDKATKSKKKKKKKKSTNSSKTKA